MDEEMWTMIDRRYKETTNIGIYCLCCVCSKLMKIHNPNSCQHQFCHNCLNSLLKSQDPLCPKCPIEDNIKLIAN